MEVAGLLNDPPDDRNCIVKAIDCIRNDIGDALKPVKRRETIQSHEDNFKIFVVSCIAGAFIRSVTF